MAGSEACNGTKPTNPFCGPTPGGLAAGPMFPDAKTSDAKIKKDPTELGKELIERSKLLRNLAKQETDPKEQARLNKNADSCERRGSHLLKTGKEPKITPEAQSQLAANKNGELRKLAGGNGRAPSQEARPAGQGTTNGSSPEPKTKTTQSGSDRRLPGRSPNAPLVRANPQNPDAASKAPKQPPRQTLVIEY